MHFLDHMPLFVEDLRSRFKLYGTHAYLEFIGTWESKMPEINFDSHTTGTMKNQTQRKANKFNLHVVRRFIVHEFYHIL